MKRKSEIAALEWDDFVLQEKLKYLMYNERSLCGDLEKEKLTDELNSKSCVRLKRNKTRKFFVGIKFKKKGLSFIL